MKKALLVLAAVVALVGALGVAGFAYAQNQFPQRFGGMMGQNGYGPAGGMMNGTAYGSMRDMMNGRQGFGGRYGMGGMMGADGQYGPMHEYMLDAVAGEIGLSPEDLQTRMEAGESMWDIAAAQGLSTEDITTLMQSAHNQAVAKAVAQGVITPEQAEWMNSHMQQMHTNGFGRGGCHGTGTPGGRQTSSPTS